jgi:hypothetical protein
MRRREELDPMIRLHTFGRSFSPCRPCSQGRSRASRPLALALALSMLLPSAATVLLPAAAWAQGAAPSTAADLAAIHIPTVPAAEGRIHTILMFPFASKVDAASANGFDGDLVGAQVENAIKMRLNIIGRYKADSFSPTLPQIQRAVTDSGLAGITETDVAPPYDSAGKGRKLADEIATDGYLLGTIEAIQTNPQTRTVSLTITATLYSTETGRAVKALAYTGRGISYSTSDDPTSLLQSAINDAAGHVVSALNADVAQAPIKRDVKTVHHNNRVGEVVLGVLLAAAIAIGITASHNSGHHGSSGTTTTTTTTTPPPVIGGTPPAPPFGG